MVEEKQVVEYNITEAAIAEMSNVYMGLAITDLKDKKAFDAVHSARMVVKGKRVDVEKTRKELKKTALEWGRKVDSRAKEIFGLLEPIETHLNTEENKVKEEKARIEAERAAKEQARVDGIQLSLKHLNDQAIVYGLTAAEIQTRIDETEAIDILESEFQERYKEAIELGVTVLKSLADDLGTQAEIERADAERIVEAGRLAKEREELEKIRKEQEAKDAKIEAERLELQAEKDRIEREEFERKAKEEARIQAEKDANAKVEREAQEAKERAEKEAREAEARVEAEAAEKARLEALKPDKEKMVAWANSLLNATQPDTKDQSITALLEEALSEVYEIANRLLTTAKEL